MLDLVERTMPSDIDAEMAMVAAAIQYRPFTVAIQNLGIVPEDCYHETNEKILRAVYAMAGRNEKVDLITLRHELKGDPEIDYGYVTEVTTGFVVPQLAMRHAGIVKDKSARRQAIVALRESLKAMYDPSVPDPVGDARVSLAAVGTASTESAMVDFHRTLASAVKAQKRAFTTGFSALDHMVWVEPGDFCIIGARPSDGKTALALQLMLHIAETDRVIFHSLEMSRRAIATRYLAMLSGVGSHRLRTGEYSEGESAAITDARKKAERLKLRIDDRAGLTVAQIASELKREMLNGKVGAVFVDHLLKVRPVDSRATRHQQMSQISNDLAQLAHDTKVTVVGLYQLSRSSAKETRKPRVDDLRETGTVEEDADHIWLLHRPDHVSPISEASLLVEKDRNGPCGAIDLMFYAEQTRFKPVPRPGSFA